MKKCFASRVSSLAGECGIEGSKEHYISESVLKEVALDGTSIFLTGAKWQVPGEPMEVGISSMVSRILCDRHNSGMADFDAAAKGFFNFLRPRSRVSLEIDGNHLEKWMAKTLIGLYESGSMLSPIEDFSLPHHLYEYLFSDTVLSAPMGLTLINRSRSIRMEPDFLVGPYFDENRVFSYVFRPFSIEAHFPFEKLELPFESFFRPVEITKKARDGEFKLTIQWKEGMINKPVPFFTITEKETETE